MPWTYDPATLSTNELYAIRLEIGDTDPLDPQLPDEAIIWAASQERNFWATSARCLEMIMRFKLRKADVRLGRQMMITYTKMAAQLEDQARALRRKAMGTVAPFVGGMNVTTKLTYAQDPNLVQGQFTKTMMVNPWAAPYTTDSTDPVGGGTQVPEQDNI